MSELNKTTIFLVAALASVALAIFTRPSTEDYNVEERRGKLLVEDFPPEAPRRLEIKSLDEETGDLEAFEVAEIDGRWTIPSKSGYPADATQQMASAVEGVVGREILDVVDAGAADQATYGVVDPDDPNADEGFGTHVRLSDETDKVLADLIIGKEVTGAEGHHWVRKAQQDVVYDVEIDLAKFSTDFADWIEKDLLGLSTFDVSQVLIDDYSAEPKLVLTQQGLLQDFVADRHARMHLIYDDDQSKWRADSLEQYDSAAKEYEPFTLDANQQLNEDTLRELKNALDDLEIVDVERKPDGLSGDLKAGAGFIKSQEAVRSLAMRGFIPQRVDPKNPASDIVLLSSEGEIVVTLKDGVEYVLRFGDLQLDSSAEAGETPADGATAEEEKSKDDEGLNRYLFVMARFNEAAIEKPVAEPLPELPPADEPATDDQPAAEGENSQAEAADDSDEQDSDSDEAAAEESDKPTRDQIEADRKRIDENNKRAEEEYQEKVEKGRKRVEELNARFGDWYYVIPNDVFKQIHLGRDQVIKTAEPEQGADNAAADAGESVLGAPGSAIPGLPSVDTSEQPSPSAEEPASPSGDEASTSAEESSPSATETGEAATDETPADGQ